MLETTLRPLLIVGALTLFGVGTPPAQADLIGHGGMIRSIDVSPDASHVLTASFDYSAKLWRLDEQREVLSLDHHDGPVNAARFLPGGTRAVSVGADGRTVFWSLRDGSVEAEFADHQGRVMAVDISMDERDVLTGGWDGRMVIRNIDDGALRGTLETEIPIVAAAFLDGDQIVAAGRDGLFRVYRRDDGSLVDEVAAHNLGLTALDRTTDGTRFITVGLDNAARVWRATDLKMTAEFFADPAVKPVSVALDATGRTAAITYIDGLLIHIEVETATLIHGFRVDTRPVMAVNVTGDGQFAVTAGMDESARIWHLASGDAIDADTAGDADRPQPWLETDEIGAVMFRKCAICHAVTATERQRAGPHFEGLFGRPSGAVEDYRYSEALAHGQVVWTHETIAALFREGPDRYAPGTKMPVQQIQEEDELTALVDYMAVLLKASE